MSIDKKDREALERHNALMEGKFAGEKLKSMYDEMNNIKLPWLEFEVDLKFWATLPCINLNFHFPQLEVEWLCFALYIRIGKYEL